MTQEERRAESYLCSKCGEPINMSRNNYRIIGIQLDAAWRSGAKGEPPPCVYKHKHCMDADEWKIEDSIAA